MNPDDITHRFQYHPPTTQERVDQHTRARQLFRDLAHNINELTPDGREKSLAVTALEEALFWTNAAIARQPDAHR